MIVFALAVPSSSGTIPLNTNRDRRKSVAGREMISNRTNTNEPCATTVDTENTEYSAKSGATNVSANVWDVASIDRADRRRSFIKS